MGSTPSVTLDGPLQALTDPLIAVNPMYCSPNGTTLHLEKTMFGKTAGLAIRDLSTDQMSFHVRFPHMSLSLRKALCTPENVPIVHMQHKKFSTATYHIYQDVDSIMLLFTIKFHSQYGRKLVDIDFLTEKNRRYQVEIEGNWDKRGVIFWLLTENVNQNSKKQQAIGGIRYSPSTSPSDYNPYRSNFDLDIAPNVDMALMILICLGLEDIHRPSY
jgi:hypothetical protein